MAERRMFAKTIIDSDIFRRGSFLIEFKRCPVIQGNDQDTSDFFFGQGPKG